MGCFDTNKGDEEDKVRKEANKKIEKQLQKDKQTYRATHRLLLLGMCLHMSFLNVCLCRGSDDDDDDDGSLPEDRFIGLYATHDHF